VTCNNFADYFVNKINRIKSAIGHQLNSDKSDATVHDPVFTGQLLDELSAPTVDEVRKLINSMPAKSSRMDAIPTSIVKSCADVFAPLIAHLTELCFRDGVFPARYKTASVTPLLKKDSRS